MGYYIQTGSDKGKADDIVEWYYGEEIDCPDSFEDVPENKALICVVENVLFDAAGYAYDKNEFEAFSRLDDQRPKRWILIDKEIAEELTGRKKVS